MLRPLHKRWTVRDVVILGLLLGVGAWIHRTALLDIWMIGAGRSEQSHILLAPFVSGWLFWLRRSRLRSVRVSPSLWGPVLIMLGWTASWVGIETDTIVIWHGSALVTLLGCVVTVTGLAPLKLFAPAVVALLFVIPMPGSIRGVIAVPLQAMATVVTQFLLELFGVPTTRLGNVLTINGEQIAVGEACNGMRMVFALGVTIYAFVFSVPLRPSMRVLLLAISPLLALACNVVRLIPTAVIFGYGTAEQSRVFHDASGWVMLPIALVMLIGVLRLTSWIDVPIMSLKLTMK